MLFVVMFRSVIYLLLFVLTFSACKDEFNDPNPDYQEIIDNEAPTIEFLTPNDNDTLRAIDTLNISLKFTDNYQLESMSLNLAPINVQGNIMNFAVNSSDSIYQLDTFYLLPAADTIEIGMLSTCKDVAGNVNSKSINLSVIK